GLATVATAAVVLAVPLYYWELGYFAAWRFYNVSMLASYHTAGSGPLGQEASRLADLIPLRWFLVAGLAYGLSIALTGKRRRGARASDRARASGRSARRDERARRSPPSGRSGSSGSSSPAPRPSRTTFELPTFLALGWLALFVSVVPGLHKGNYLVQGLAPE